MCHWFVCLQVAFVAADSVCETHETPRFDPLPSSTGLPKYIISHLKKKSTLNTCILFTSCGLARIRRTRFSSCANASAVSLITRFLIRVASSCADWKFFIIFLEFRIESTTISWYVNPVVFLFTRCTSRRCIITVRWSLLTPNDSRYVWITGLFWNMLKLTCLVIIVSPIGVDGTAFC